MCEDGGRLASDDAKIKFESEVRRLREAGESNLVDKNGTRGNGDRLWVADGKTRVTFRAAFIKGKSMEREDTVIKNATDEQAQEMDKRLHSNLESACGVTHDMQEVAWQMLRTALQLTIPSQVSTKGSRGNSRTSRVGWRTMTIQRIRRLPLSMTQLALQETRVMGWRSRRLNVHPQKGPRGPQRHGQQVRS